MISPNKSLSERDICTKFITPAIKNAGWNIDTQMREEVSFTDGKITVRGNITARGQRKRADYILYYKPNIPIAIAWLLSNNGLCEIFRKPFGKGCQRESTFGSSGE